jgi:glycerol-3-phosphate dehydrogenase
MASFNESNQISVTTMGLPSESNAGRLVSDRKVIAVIGAGAFGTALAQIAARCGNHVKIYARNEEVVEAINTRHINPHYLSEFELSESISATTSVKEALDGADFAILAIPTQLVTAYYIILINYCLPSPSIVGAKLAFAPQGPDSSRSATL